MIAGIILAGGKGTRMKSKNINKAALPLLGKPLIQYGIDLLKPITEILVVVIGAYAESVKHVLSDQSVVYTYQKDPLGTGNALEIGMGQLKDKNIKLVLAGYGDHMMFYSRKTIQDLIQTHKKNKAVISLITVKYDQPDKLAWGRIKRNSEGKIISVIEQKDSSSEDRKITEVNAGFYCFEYKFLQKHIHRIPRSPVTGEYYINSFIDLAAKKGKSVIGLQVTFIEVGIGVNTKQDLKEAESLFIKIKK